MHEYTPIVSSLFDMIVLYYWRREAGRERGGYGNNSRTGVAVSEEMKEGSQVRESMEREREEGQRGGMKER